MLGTRGNLPVKPTERGIAHLLLAARYSYRGLRSAWRYEESFRQEALVIVVMVPLAIWLARDIVDFLLLTLPMLLSLLMSLLMWLLYLLFPFPLPSVFSSLFIGRPI